MRHCPHCQIDNPPISMEVVPGATKDDPPRTIAQCLRCKKEIVEREDPPRMPALAALKTQHDKDTERVAQIVREQIRGLTREEKSRDVTEPSETETAPARPLPLAKMIGDRLRYVRAEIKRLRAFEKEEAELVAQQNAIRTARKQKKVAPVRKLPVERSS